MVDEGEVDVGGEAEGEAEVDAKGRVYGQGGFTLLEVLIAVAILSLSLSSMLTSQINSMRATTYARGLTSAAFLAEWQLVELEYQQRRDGWVTSDVEVEGEFDEQGWPDIRYECFVDFIELPEYSELVNAKTDADNATDGDSAMVQDSGDQAFGMLGVVWPVIKQAIENSIRKSHCTTFWTDGKHEYSTTVATFWVDMNGLSQLPQLGGEYTEDDDDSGAGEPGSGAGTSTGSTPGAGGRGPSSMGPGTEGRG